MKHKIVLEHPDACCMTHKIRFGRKVRGDMARECVRLARVFPQGNMQRNDLRRIMGSMEGRTGDA